MNYKKITFMVLLAAFMVACEAELPNEVTELNLSQCLTPSSVSATVENDNEVLFSWTAAKDADSYDLVVAEDAEYTEVVNEFSVLPSQVPFKVEMEPGVYYYKVRAAAKDKKPSFWACGSKAVTIKKPVVAMDLSLEGTANCYVAEPSGSYKFKPTKGCTSDAVGTISKVEVLWETAAALSTPAKNSIVEKIGLDAEGYITFSTAANVGNALLAAYDADNKILWSWHIWVIADVIADVNLGNGMVLMDRNIGETSNTITPRTSMLYQWGRKDPFPGTCGTNAILGVAGAVATLNTGQTTPESSIAYPTTLYGAHASTGSQPYGLGGKGADNHNYSDDQLWGDPSTGEKTQYDPCPAGYRVPHAWTDTKITDNVITGSRFEFLKDLAFYTKETENVQEGHYTNTFDITFENGQTLRFGRTGSYLLNTTDANKAALCVVEEEGSVKYPKVCSEGNVFYLWTAGYQNKRIATCLRVGVTSGSITAELYTKPGDTYAQYQAKNNAYPIRCEKIK